jgi:beta-mannosidase
VPGNVRVDLIQAGVLPDLGQGMQPETAQWADDYCWWLVRDFSLSRAPTERVHLILRGVDYVSDLFLNGQYLGRHEGMFSPQVHEVTHLLGDENRLAVRIAGSRWLPQDRSSWHEKLLNRIEAGLSNMPGRFPHRRDTLKCQMGFGWDFAPPLRTMGVWDDVYLVISEDVFIQDLRTGQQVMGDAGTVTAQLAVDTDQRRCVQLRCTLSGETFEDGPVVAERTVDLVPGLRDYILELAVTRPRLWWPWDHGYPDLYRMTVEVLHGGRVLDSVSQTLGLRQIELRDWTVHVNGRRVYARGANWVPADLFPGRVTDSDYHALLTLARQANMNLLRLWGGGLREKRTFYDLCDRLGILVWQEFPFACALLTRHPRSQAYLRLVETEARAIVRDLRNHPSIALWCGGNEFSPRRNAPLVDVLQRVVASEDPMRPFLPASPACGDSHNWQVWHHHHPPAVYRQDETAFASEFGLQAPPDVAALHRFLPPEDLWPPGPSWIYHGAGLAKLRRYARPFLNGEVPTLESFVGASQRAQAQGLQIAIEHYRRSKARGCGGALVWQLNEPWAAISWALLDYFRQPKPAYEMVKRLYNPLLISLDLAPKQLRPGDILRCDVWIINDTSWAHADCCMEVVLRDGKGKSLRKFARTVKVTSDSAEVVDSLEWALPAESGWRLACQLTHLGRILSKNEYDLTVYDDIQPMPSQRLRRWLTGLLTPA